MKNTTIEKTTTGFCLSAAVMSILNTLLVIIKELMPPFKAGMAKAMGHHWTTHGVAVLGLFVVLGFVLASTVKTESWSTDKLGKAIVWSVILSCIALALFYLLH